MTSLMLAPVMATPKIVTLATVIEELRFRLGGQERERPVKWSG